MESQGRCSATLIAMVVLVLSTAVAVQGASHSVGGALGWHVPGTVGTTANYLADWPKNQTFAAGDTLLFVYPEGRHSVYTVDAASYAPCTLTTPLLKSTTGNDSLTLAAGANYFVCGVPGHCTLGMKIMINATATPPGTISPPSSPGTISPPGSPGTAAAPAPGNNAAGTGLTIIQVVAAVAVSIVALWP